MFSFIKKAFSKKKNCKKSIIVSGGGNKLIIADTNGNERIYKDGDYIAGLNIKITGNNNFVKLSAKTTFINSFINIASDNNTVQINEVEKAIFGLDIWNGDNQCFVWDCGAGSARFAAFYMCQAFSRIEINKDCLLSDVTIWSGDAHTVYDKKTGKITNGLPHTVSIGEHCWIAAETFLTKNASLPPNTIVGARTVIAKKFEKEFTCIAGNPAKIIKTDITWS